MSGAVGFCATVKDIEKRKKALLKKIKDGNSNISVEGDADFKSKTNASLDKLASTPTGLLLLEGIDRTDKPVRIVETTGGNTENATNWNDGLYDQANGKPGAGSGSRVDFNPDKKQISDGSQGWHKRDPAVALGHELIHSYHDANGTTDGRNPVSYTDKNGATRSAPGYEHQAVGLGAYEDSPLTENNIRKDMGEDERPFY